MTVVMQHWFDDLDVSDEGFAVTLNFGDAPERLYVPYDAIKTFVDPSVEFGLRFETQDGEDGEDDDDPTPPTPPERTEKASDAAGDAEVVSLDSFRK